MKNMDWSAPAYNSAAAGQHWFVRMKYQGLWRYIFGLIWLGIPIYYVLNRSSSLESKTVAVAWILLVAVFYLGLGLAVEWRFFQRLLWLGALVVAVVGASISANQPREIPYFSFYIAVAIAMLIPLDIAFYVILLLGLVNFAITCYPTPDIEGMALVFGSMVLGFSIISGIRVERRKGIYEKEQKRITAELAVARERERIGQDLHDILGHSLTVIAIKADLAQRLLDKDLAAVDREISQLRLVATQALADVRATTAGLRQVRLSVELANAPRVLAAAGISCTAPSALPAFDEETSQMLGYVLRECVTNIIRHSEATHCEIEITDDLLIVRDNGKGMTGSEGNGIAGLRKRCQEWGPLSVVSSSEGTSVILRKEQS
ncbi:MAG: sensor histidine kinase [Propionibacteriaceae bacterium]